MTTPPKRKNPNLHRRARLVDVARLAGTSPPIASRVLNEDPTLSVGPDLRDRVRAAAAELRYRPHAGARGLRKAKVGALGLLMPPLTNPVYARILRGAYKRALEHGFVALVAEDFEHQEADESFVRLFEEGRIDGLLVASARLGHPLFGVVDTFDIPHVFVNRAVAGSNRNVVMDDARASRLALDHFYDLGHRNIGHIAGFLDIDPARRRADSFKKHAKTRGLPRVHVEEGEFLERGGADAARRLLTKHPKVTAIYTSSPSQAAGALYVAWSLGIHVPEDLSILAYTDTPLAEVLIPPLSTVSMPLEELGSEAVDSIVSQLNGEEPSDRLVSRDIHIIERESTGRARADSGPTRTRSSH